MKKNNIGYLLREGFKGVFLHGFMSFAAICVTVACLIIMGTFSLILYNLHVMILDLEQENEAAPESVRYFHRRGRAGNPSLVGNSGMVHRVSGSSHRASGCPP